MTELKTLKDLRFFQGSGRGDYDYADREELKTEAIKWVKSFEANKEIDKNYLNGAIWEFRRFFNLTEEDLK